MDDIIRAGIRFGPGIYFCFILDLSTGDGVVQVQLTGPDGTPVTFDGSMTWNEGE